MSENERARWVLMKIRTIAAKHAPIDTDLRGDEDGEAIVAAMKTERAMTIAFKLKAEEILEELRNTELERNLYLARLERIKGYADYCGECDRAEHITELADGKLRGDDDATEPPYEETPEEEAERLTTPDYEVPS